MGVADGGLVDVGAAGKHGGEGLCFWGWGFGVGACFGVGYFGSTGDDANVFPSACRLARKSFSCSIPFLARIISDSSVSSGVSSPGCSRW